MAKSLLFVSVFKCEFFSTVHQYADEYEFTFFTPISLTRILLLTIEKN